MWTVGCVYIVDFDIIFSVVQSVNTTMWERDYWRDFKVEIFKCWTFGRLRIHNQVHVFWYCLNFQTSLRENVNLVSVFVSCGGIPEIKHMTKTENRNFDILPQLQPKNFFLRSWSRLNFVLFRMFWCHVTAVCSSQDQDMPFSSWITNILNRQRFSYSVTQCFFISIFGKFWI